MNIVVLGATGFLGSNIVSQLLKEHHHVTAFCRRGPRTETLRKAGVSVVEGDLLSRDSILGLDFGTADALVHCASTTSPAISISGPAANRADIESSTLVFQRAASSGVERIAFISSGGTVYGNPTKIPVSESRPVDPLTPYAQTKIAIESALMDLCADSSTTPIILRYGNPYGPNQYPERGTGVITAWLEAAKDRKPIRLFGYADNARDFVFISDASEAMLSALQRRGARGVYNIGSGTATELTTLIETIEKITGSRLEQITNPPRPSDKVSQIALDSTRAREELGWSSTTSLEEGISVTWNWVREGEPFRLS